MARIEIKEGEAVEVTFGGTDRVITVAFKAYGSNTCVGCDYDVARELPSGISVHADMPDSYGREGVVYNEPFHPVHGKRTKKGDR